MYDYNAGTMEWELVGSPVAGTDGEYGYQRIDLSPDGSRLAYIARNLNFAGWYGVKELVGGAWVDIGSTAFTYAGGAAVFPIRVTYALAPSRDLFLFRSGATDATILIYNASEPVWAPGARMPPNSARR